MNKKYEGTEWTLRVYEIPTWRPVLEYCTFSVEVYITDSNEIHVEIESDECSSYAITDLPWEALMDLAGEHQKWLTSKQK